MADETDPKPSADLKARLGLQNKLDSLAAGRRSADNSSAPKPLKASEVQQPPRPKSRFEEIPSGTIPTMEAEAISKSPRSVVVIACIVVALVVLGAGYVIGKAFQMRALYNVQIDNAAKVHDIVFDRVPDHIELKRSWAITRDLLRAVKENTDVAGAVEKAKEALQANLDHPTMAAAPEIKKVIKAFKESSELSGADGAAIQKRAEAFLEEVATHSSSVSLMKSFFAQTKSFNESIEALLQDKELKPDERTAKLFEGFQAFLQQVAAYRTYNIRFPLKDIARKDFYFVDIVPDMARLDSAAVRLNSVADAMIQDEGVFQFIQKSRDLRSGESEQFSRLFWIKGNKKQNAYDEGHLIVMLHQKEKLNRSQMGQAVTLQSKPDDPLLIPVGNIAKISLGGTIKPYVETFENTVRARMLGNQRARLQMLLDLGETFGIQSLLEKVDEYRNRSPYFVL